MPAAKPTKPAKRKTESITVALGQHIADRRRSLGRTQQDVGILMGLRDADAQAMVSQYESGSRGLAVPTIAVTVGDLTIVRLAAALDWSLVDLLAPLEKNF